MEFNIKELVQLVLLPIVIVILGYINEKGFENLVSQPIVEKLRVLKPYQPYLVVVTGILLSYISKQVGMNLVPDLAPYVAQSGDVATVFAGILIAVVSMALHKPGNEAVG